MYVHYWRGEEDEFEFAIGRTLPMPGAFYIPWYLGSVMGPSDCIWIVPGTIEED